MFYLLIYLLTYLVKSMGIVNVSFVAARVSGVATKWAGRTRLGLRNPGVPEV